MLRHCYFSSAAEFSGGMLAADIITSTAACARVLRHPSMEVASSTQIVLSSACDSSSQLNSYSVVVVGSSFVPKAYPQKPCLYMYIVALAVCLQIGFPGSGRFGSGIRELLSQSPLCPSPSRSDPVPHDPVVPSGSRSTCIHVFRPISIRVTAITL